MTTKEKFRENGIVNTWDLIKKFGRKGERIGCSFQGSDRSRGGGSAHAYVWSPDFKTDPKAPWYCYGRKTFYAKRGVALGDAVMWARKEYGIEEWAPSPVDPNDYVPKRIRVEALKWLKAWVKIQPESVVE